MNSTARALLIAAALVVIAAGMKAAQEVIVPFLLAAFIATIAAPPVLWLEKRRVPAVLAEQACFTCWVNGAVCSNMPGFAAASW